MKLQLSINPVTLKELRQLVRSRLILWGIVALPIVLLVATALVLSAEMHGLSPMEATYGKGLGTGPLIAVTAVTGIVTCGLIPLFTSIRTAIETSKASLGLEFTTALTSAQIATGKIAAAAIISAIAVALAMPFFVLSYLMRGVELASTFLIPLELLVASVVMSSLGLLPACSRRSIAMKIILLMALYAVLSIFTTSLSAFFSIRGALAGGTSSSWPIAGMFFAFAVPAFMVAYGRAQAAAELAPPHTDFARTLRITQAVLFAVGFPLIFAGKDPCVLWSTLWTLVAGMIALGAAARPLPVTRGAALHAPRPWLLRVLAFPFATGSMPSMFFASLLAMASSSMLVLSTGGTIDFDDARFAIVLTCECGSLVVAAGSIARMIVGAHPRLATSVGKAAAAYIFMINGLQFLTALDVLERTALRPFPCCIEGVRRVPNGHLVIAIVMVIAAICLAMAAAREDFKRFRKP
ncbi:MAG: hypothetical protein IJJ84_15630 [Kiritimatiellae bacterium]|nr:hypothetical protein [Kiritimatiellia bacterium]